MLLDPLLSFQIQSKVFMKEEEYNLINFTTLVKSQAFAAAGLVSWWIKKKIF
jgi:hypothetical protein